MFDIKAFEKEIHSKCVNGVYGHLIDLHGLDLTELPDLSDIEVTGYYSCSCNNLTSLKGVPKKIGTNFYAYGNKLTFLDYFPKEVGGEIDVNTDGQPVQFTEEDIIKAMNKIENIVFDRSVYKKHLKALSILVGKKFKHITAPDNIYTLDIDENFVILGGIVYSPECIDFVDGSLFREGQKFLTLVDDTKSEALDKIKVLEEELAKLKKIINE